MDIYTKAKLDYLEDTKEAIKDSMIAVGLEVSDTDTFRSYAEKIASLEQAENNSF